MEPKEMRMKFYSLVVLSLVCLLAACAAAPPKSQRLVHHSELDGNSGALLMVDVCLNQDLLGDDDYFVVREARVGAQALIDAGSRYLSASGVSVGAKLIPFVCGALHDSDNQPKRAAESVGGATTKTTQPFGVTDELARDPEYLGALQKLATHVFQSAITAKRDAVANNSASSAILLSPAEARSAATVVAGRTHHSSLIYIGVTGNSLSTGKATASGVARFTIGLAISLAVGPIAVGDTSQALIFVPGGPADTRQMVAGLVDLRSGTLIQSNIVHGGGDPMKHEVLTQPDAIQLLLRDLVFTNAKQ
jgi:hypothetical protein